MTEHVGTETETSSDDYQAGYRTGQADHEAGAYLGEKEKLEEWQTASEAWKRGWGHGYEAAAQDADDVNVYDIEVSDVDVSFQTGIGPAIMGSDTFTLGDAANAAAINLIRVGLDGYAILYTDRPTGRQWIAQDGRFVAVPQEESDAATD